MSRFLHTLVAHITKRSRRQSTRLRDCHARLQMEALEDRLVPAITDQTQLAQLFPPHNGPTHLYLNFDGFTNVPKSLTGDGLSHSISAFSGTNQQIQDIIYLTSEIYAPFNVEVSRIYGNGAYDSSNNGNTTIFIGADSANVYRNLKFNHSMTPLQFSDFPGTTLGDFHLPNSDPYDLAFVDPVAQSNYSTPWTIVQSDLSIAESIAHEAGHTFGLAHVVSTTTPDIMSYYSNNQYFANQTFNITDLNFNGVTTTNDPAVQPQFLGTTITTQDSFTYLEAVLGNHPADGAFHVVHTGSVDTGSYWDIPFAPDLYPGAQTSGNLYRLGDYDVHEINVARTESLTVNITPQGNSGLIPELLVYDQNGNLVQNGVIDSWWNGQTGKYEIHTNIQFQANETYSLVVGSADGDSTGGYNLSVSGGLLIVPVNHFPLPINYLQLSTLATTSGSQLSSNSLVANSLVQNDAVFAGVGEQPLTQGTSLFSNLNSNVNPLPTSNQPSLSHFDTVFVSLNNLNNQVTHYFPPDPIDVASPKLGQLSNSLINELGTRVSNYEPPDPCDVASPKLGQFNNSLIQNFLPPDPCDVASPKLGQLNNSLINELGNRVSNYYPPQPTLTDLSHQVSNYYPPDPCDVASPRLYQQSNSLIQDAAWLHNSKPAIVIGI